ncbi:MAG: hypothetical protein KDB21_11165 [Acidimicrobiales bacterium]|nr:hypothetical protein [Acidimicrobiales bacterium]
MPRIGGTLADLLDTGAAMDRSGGAAIDSGTRAREVTAAVRSEIDGVASTLRGHFAELAAGLREQIAAGRARLESADWHGSSRLNAAEADAALHADVDRVLVAADEGVHRLSAELLGRIEGFETQVATEFTAVLGAIDEAYRGLAQATRTFAEQLEAADRTIRFSR